MGMLPVFNAGSTFNEQLRRRDNWSLPFGIDRL